LVGTANTSQAITLFGAKPPEKPTTDMNTSLNKVTMKGLHDGSWPSAKLLLKLEAAAGEEIAKQHL
jgi:hypothetical protein